MGVWGMVRRSLRIAWIVVLALPLAGCLSDQKHAVTTCEVGGASQMAVENCMVGKSYVPDFGSDYCRSIAAKPVSPYCYRPRGWFARLELDLDLLFNPPPAPPVTAS